MGDKDALLKGHEIHGFGLCVPDVITTAKQYGELLGVGPWQFYDQQFDYGVRRMGVSQIGHLTIELFEPLAHEKGQENRFDYMSLGEVADHDAMVEIFEEQGVPREIQTDRQTGASRTLLDLRDRLATRLEISNLNHERPEPLAVYEPPAESLINVSGRHIVQFGVVVDDARKYAEYYSALFDIGDWVFPEFKPTDEWEGVYRDIPMSGARFYIKAALAMHGDMQIELLEPVSGTSTHMDFLRQYGCGVHHVSFGPIDDHDELTAKLREGGIEVEMAGQVGNGAWFTYLRTAERLGTIFEMVGRSPA